MKQTKIILLSIILLIANAFTSVAQEDKNMECYPVFKEGENGAHSYRIPAMVTAKDGALLVFIEARYESWVDKTYTDMVVKRSTDGGRSWSDMYNLSNGESGAYMDPSAVVDPETGRIILFFSFWPADDHSGKANRVFCVTSDDNGLTWTEKEDVTKKITPKGKIINGFGPGSGLAMKGDKFRNRLIIPVRITDSNAKNGRLVALYSDNGGKSWSFGETGDRGGEIYMAESPENTLVVNIRANGSRWVARSTDGGESWSESKVDPALVTVSKGCQSSIKGVGNTLYYCGITGRPETSDFDERCALTLFISHDGGHNWSEKRLLYPKAAGYSDISFLNTGEMVIVFEASDTPGFARGEIRKDWMRVDLLVIKDILNK